MLDLTPRQWQLLFDALRTYQTAHCMVGQSLRDYAKTNHAAAQHVAQKDADVLALEDIIEAVKEIQEEEISK